MDTSSRQTRARKQALLFWASEAPKGRAASDKLRCPSISKERLSM